MNKKYKAIISLGLVSLLTACGSGTSLTLSEGFTQADLIRTTQQSLEFEAPASFKIKRNFEMVDPNGDIILQKITQEIIVDTTHNYAYEKIREIDDFGGDDKIDDTIEKWTYLRDDRLLVAINNVGKKSYTDVEYNPETNTTFVDIRNSYKNFYLGNDALAYLLDDVHTAEMANPFLSDSFYNQAGDSFSTKKISITSKGEGSLKVDLKLDQTHNEDKYNYVFNVIFDDSLLSSYYYYEIQKDQFIRSQITVSNQFEHKHPDLKDYSNSTPSTPGN